MKKKLKLAFEELEAEMSTLTYEELKQLIGGSGGGGMGSGGGPGGSGSSNPNFWTNQGLMDYFSGLGFEFTEDANGNLYSDGYKWMPEVTVTGYINNTGSNGGNPINNIYEDLTFQQAVDAYAGFFTGLGYSFSGSDGNYLMDSKPLDKGPFFRGTDGKIIIESSGIIIDYDAYYTPDNAEKGVRMCMEQVTLFTSNGPIAALRVLEVRDGATGNVVPLEAKYMANCMGAATGDGEYWFINDPSTPYEDEGKAYDNMILDYYEECDPEEATIAVCYTGYGTSSQSAYHAGKVNADGTFTAKGGITDLTDYATEAEFRDGGAVGIEDDLYEIGTIIYYKPK